MGDLLDELRGSLDDISRQMESSEGLARAHALVTAEPTRALSLQDVADAAGCSMWELSRRFRLQVGISFRSWYRAVRVARALELLRSGRYSAEAIARQAGFGSLRAMERAFRVVVGLSPREARKMLRERSSAGTEQGEDPRQVFGARTGGSPPRSAG